MTAMSAGVALVLLLIDAETPGEEILHPVAVTIFGVLSATILDMLLMPVLFLRYCLGFSRSLASQGHALDRD